jgi:sec-independent protein translocase protein TatC
MFYLKELYFRFYYIVFSFLNVLGIFWLYKKSLLTFLTFSLWNSLVFEHFIYTSPTEVFSTYLHLVLYFSLLLIVPFFVWQFVDFIKSSLYRVEYISIINNLTHVFSFIFLINIISFLVIFPYIWQFFNLFNQENESSHLLTFSLELKVQEYFNFFFSFIYVVNFFAIVLLFLLFILSQLDLKQKLYWKKLFTFFNVVFATLLSPPDVFSQLFFLIMLIFFFELIVIFSILRIKMYKYI